MASKIERPRPPTLSVRATQGLNPKLIYGRSEAKSVFVLIFLLPDTFDRCVPQPRSSSRQPPASPFSNEGEGKSGNE